jgi:hypothetical protein
MKEYQAGKYIDWQRSIILPAKLLPLELAEKIATCAQLYEINKCFPISQRVPALAQHCADWESCMQRDPTGVGRAKVVAETIGEVINSFVEPISWKTLVSL